MTEDVPQDEEKQREERLKRRTDIAFQCWAVARKYLTPKDVVDTVAYELFIRELNELSGEGQ